MPLPYIQFDTKEIPRRLPTWSGVVGKFKRPSESSRIQSNLVDSISTETFVHSTVACSSVLSRYPLGAVLFPESRDLSDGLTSEFESNVSSLGESDCHISSFWLLSLAAKHPVGHSLYYWLCLGSKRMSEP